jgi:LysM repeat protein
MKPISFKAAFAIVLAIHLIIITVVMGSANKARADDERFLKSKEAVYTGIEIKPTPSPTPRLVDTNKIKQLDATKVDKNYPSAPTQVIVQKGDTLTKISKKYSVSIDNILKLNNLKDINKIILGQKLILRK